MKPPPRLLEDPALAPELRTDLERAATTAPNYDVRAGLGALQAAIIASAAASASAPSSAAAAHASSAGATAAGKASGAGVWSTLAAKATVASLVAAAAVTTTVIAWPSAQRERTVASHKAVTHGAASQAARTIAPPASEATAPVPNSAAAPAEPAAVPVPEPARVAVPESVPARVPVSALRGGAADLRQEIDQLARIKSLVETDPARAYRLAQQGDRDFPRGMLRQEREALAIVALANNGRRPEAALRLRAFVTRYPHSPARERLEQLLGTAGE